jgi:ABC-type uncharacterized transport system permease subunit
MKSLKINIVAVIVLALAHQVLNFGWYTLAGDSWLTAANLTVPQIEANQSPLSYLASMVAAFLACWMLAWLFVQLKVESLVQGILYAISFYGCFLFFQSLTKDMFHLHPLRLTLINEGINFINFALSGAVLGAWKKYEA